MGSIQYSESLDYPIETPDGSYVMPTDNNNGKKHVGDGRERNLIGELKMVL